MKLLVDENISYRILRSINDYFSGSVHVSSIKESKMTDFEIWKYAKAHDFIIVTYDQDFYEWQHLRGFPPNVVWLRFGNAPTEKIVEKLNTNIQKINNMVSSETIGLLEIH